MDKYNNDAIQIMMSYTGKIANFTVDCKSIYFYYIKCKNVVEILKLMMYKFYK